MDWDNEQAYWDEIDAREEARRDDDSPRRSQGCQCDPDMPGTCPGPANCPMCDEPEDHDE